MVGTNSNWNKFIGLDTSYLMQANIQFNNQGKPHDCILKILEIENNSVPPNLVQIHYCEMKMCTILIFHIK